VFFVLFGLGVLCIHLVYFGLRSFVFFLKYALLIKNKNMYVCLYIYIYKRKDDQEKTLLLSNNTYVPKLMNL
jgi:hypothetical protein